MVLTPDRRPQRKSPGSGSLLGRSGTEAVGTEPQIVNTLNLSALAQESHSEAKCDPRPSAVPRKFPAIVREVPRSRISHVMRPCADFPKLHQVSPKSGFFRRPLGQRTAVSLFGGKTTGSVAWLGTHLSSLPGKYPRSPARAIPRPPDSARRTPQRLLSLNHREP